MESTDRSTSSSGQWRWPGRRRSSRRIASTGARLNQGNSSKGRNSSRPSSNSQKPCREMFVTSGSEVVAPGISNVLLMFLDQLLDTPQVLAIQPVVPGQLDARVEPVLRLPIGRLDVDMQALLLAREKEEPERPVAKDRRTHQRILRACHPAKRFGDQLGVVVAWRVVQVAHGA